MFPIMELPSLINLLCVAGGAVLATGFARFIQNRGSAKKWMPNILRAHFQTTNLEMLRVAERRFPLHMRGEVDRAIRELFNGRATLHQCLGLKKDYPFAEVSFADLIDSESRQFANAPQSEEINIGEPEPLRAVTNAVWLGRLAKIQFIIVSTHDHSPCGGGSVRIQIATPNHDDGSDWAREVFQACERAVSSGRSYRGKVLSFEPPASYSGETSGITIHNLRNVDRQHVILPQQTLELLERNVVQFAQQRPQLARLGQTTKKGLLLYGPPGTGKTHTIHYLAKAVPDQTVFLISAEQVKYLSDYMTLARLLQPSLVVIEDVDLIARERSEINDPTSEVLLNKLLNEMDGLKEDALVIFLLTTNRPEALEAALTARPGRIDQAIEFPLPDDLSRERLVRLYAKGISIDDDNIVRLVKHTEGVSAAFIKEAIRRSIQFCLSRNDGDSIGAGDIDLALEEMLRGGGMLNRNLLGARSAAFAENGHSQIATVLDKSTP